MQASAGAAYGLGIHSTLPLPELVPADVPRDVSVRPGQSPGGEGIALSSPTAGNLWVRAGEEILVDAGPAADEAAVRLHVLSAGLAAILHQRRRLVLHGSAVAVRGEAVVFLGEPGSGKSTLTAAAYSLGHPLLTDDVTAVDFPDPRVAPGIPRIKLWPDAARALGYDSLPPLRPGLDKRALRADRDFPSAPLPLRRLYVLRPGDRLEETALAPGPAVVELVRHSYCTGLLPDSGDRAHFLQCAAVAESAAIRALTLPRDLAGVRETARRLLGDA